MEMGISRGLKHPCRVLLKLILDTRYLKQTIWLSWWWFII